MIYFTFGIEDFRNNSGLIHQTNFLNILDKNYKNRLKCIIINANPT